jgi:CRP/FNR family cyclic AMP-dependent transcriptional regulator
MAVDAGSLSDVELFRALDTGDRTALAATMDRHPVRAGEVLFRQGEAGTSLFVVQHGRIQLYVTDHAGQDIVLSEVGPNEVFGELSLLDGLPRTAAARSVEDGVVLTLERADLVALVRRIPDLALDLLAQMSRETRRADELLRARVSRNVNEEFEEKITPVQRVADAIAWFSGSVPFLVLHVAWFVIWVSINTMHLGVRQFDPFPFGLLTMIVSLEAIFLSCLVLIAQDRQSVKDRVRSDIEYEVNVKAELEVAHLHEKIDHLQEQLVMHLGVHRRQAP